jgi:septum formation protein
MYKNVESIVLASGSPRRKEFLESLGLDFTIAVASIKEQPKRGEPAEEFVLRMAMEKAAAVSHRFPERWIISGDTIVCLGQEILGKPTSNEHAVNLLMELSGQTHLVRSSYCLCHLQKNIVRAETIATKVEFTDFSKEIAEAYVLTGEPMDKAGAYGIQGIGGVLVKSITGSYSNVVGMPLVEIVSVLIKEKVIFPVTSQRMTKPL